MLIRQKAGWQLHHQAYLWPRKNRSTPLSPSFQPLPRRRQGRAIRRHNGKGGSSSTPVALSSLPSGSLPRHLDGEYPPRPPGRRARKGSSGGEEVDSPSSSFTSASSTSSRNSIEDLSLASSPSPSSKGRSRSSSSSSGRGSESPGREPAGAGSETSCTEEETKDPLPSEARRSQRALVQTSLKTWFKVESRPRSDTRLDAKSIQTRRRDTRSSDSSNNSSSNNSYSNLKGSSNHNNNIIHWSSNQKEPILIKSAQSHATTCSSQPIKRMGVLCTEKHCQGEKCACGGASESSPKPATLPSFSCEDDESNSQEKSKSSPLTRKRSLDTALCDLEETATPALRRRTQRSPSIGSVIANHVLSKEKLLSAEITTVLGQNGFKHDKGLNGIKKYESPNGARPLCLGTESKIASLAHHHHHPLVIPLSNVSLSIIQPSSCSLSKESVASKSSDSVPSSPVVAPGNKTCLVLDEAQSVKLPQTLSPMTSPQLPLEPHLPTQGLTGSISTDNTESESNTPVTSVCKVVTPNSTVLSLRQRPSSQTSSLSSHRPSSLPASPQPDSSHAISKSKSSLTASVSSPSLSTLAAEPPSPSHSTVVQCKWRGCTCEFDASDLLEHIRKHAETQIANKTYSCLWEDCKVFEKPSWSGSWLERHIVTHSGHRPFKCILDNCGQRFPSQATLERHVNGHFTADAQNGGKCSRSREEINHRMLQRRKRQMKRRSLQAVKRSDFFDEHTMAIVKQELLALAEHTQLDISGSTLQTTFQGTIVGRRETICGSRHSLMEFTPPAVLEDEWIPDGETDRIGKISIPLSELPSDTVTNLHKCLYRSHRFRKHRRK